MLALTRKTDYAMVALAELAGRGATWASAREIARTTGVSLPVLTNVLHLLVQNGLVVSSMGAKGGYRLARDPQRISLADVIVAIEGPVHLTTCGAHERPLPPEQQCGLEPSCRLRKPMQRVQRHVRNMLSQVTLASLLWEAEPVVLGLVSKPEGNAGSHVDGMMN